MLLLFDIDGTLLKGATQAHWAALADAIRVVHGVDAH
jgi:FMN phosphatase YigB (HAD superfamily)